MTFSDWIQKWLAQIAHLGWGAYLFMALNRHVTGWQATLIVFSFATIKEGIFDPLTETNVLGGSGFQDWIFWMLGLLLGIITTLI